MERTMVITQPGNIDRDRRFSEKINLVALDWLDLVRFSLFFVDDIHILLFVNFNGDKNYCSLCNCKHVTVNKTNERCILRIN